MSIEKQQQAIYQIVSIERSSLSNCNLIKDAIWNDDGDVDDEYNYGTGIGVWRDIQDDSVYIISPTLQINNLNSTDGHTNEIENNRFFVIDHLGTIHDASLIVCDLYNRQAVLRVKNAPKTMGVINVPKKESAAFGTKVYVLAWRLDIDAGSVMYGSVSNPNFTYNGIHDDIFINVSDYFKEDGDSGGGIKTKYGGAVFNEKNGSFIGMVHWTRLGNSYGVLPARQIYKSLLSLQYEILPKFKDGDLPELSATNDYFLGVSGRRLDSIRNIVLNNAFTLSDVVANRGNIGMFVGEVLRDSPASNAGIKGYEDEFYNGGDDYDHDEEKTTIIWALREKDCDPWTYIDEHNSFDTFVEKFSEVPRNLPLLNTVSKKAMPLYTCQTKTMQMLTSTFEKPQKLTEISVKIERARNFFNTFEDEDEYDNDDDGDEDTINEFGYKGKKTLFAFLTHTTTTFKGNSFLEANSGYGNQNQNDTS